MLQVEDLGEDDVPATTHLETHIPQAEKWHQLGVDACHRVLVACTNDLKTVAGPNALVVIVQGDTTCDMSRAWLKRRAPLGIPTHLILICRDASHLLWCRSLLHDTITDMYLAGELIVPGKPCPPKEPPADLLEKPPIRPALNVATWVGKDGSEDGHCMQLPTNVLNQWKDPSVQ